MSPRKPFEPGDAVTYRNMPYRVVLDLDTHIVIAPVSSGIGASVVSIPEASVYPA